jgi:HTH-type transcriptional regulator/antitoxin HigA
METIRSEEDYRQALKRVDVIFDAKEGTPEFEEMDRLSDLIADYEDKYYPIGSAERARAKELLRESASVPVQS